MKKIVVLFLSLTLTSLIIVLSANKVFAISAREVLGDSAVDQPLSIPPTTEGPGLILPDSPLFFLDQIKQGFRLFLAFTPEQKAKIHNAIAGERLAELQLMLAKNNFSGIRTALLGVSDNLKGASEDLSSAKLTGRDVSVLAKEINDSIKEKNNKLSILEDKATGEVKAQVAAARKALKISKVEAEDNLPDDLLVNEIKDDLDKEIEENVDNATNSVKGISHAIDVLTRLASQAAEENQKKRQEALVKAIGVKNNALSKQEEAILKAEDKAQGKSAEDKQKALEKARKAADKIDEAVGKFKEAKDEINKTGNDEKD